MAERKSRKHLKNLGRRAHEDINKTGQSLWLRVRIRDPDFPNRWVTIGYMPHHCQYCQSQGVIGKETRVYMDDHGCWYCRNCGTILEKRLPRQEAETPRSKHLRSRESYWRDVIIVHPPEAQEA